MKFFKKSVKILGKGVPIIALVALALGATLGTAALLQYYGTIVTTVEVHQSILLDGENYLTIQEDVITEPAPGGEKFCYKHWLKNQMSVEGEVDFLTTYDPELEDIEIITTYLTGTGYTETFLVDIADGSTFSPLEVTVENGDCTLTWMFDFPVEEFTGDGNLNVGLIVALGGEGNGPAFQIHNNDGTDPSYDWGTWLYSPWGPTIDDGWLGWHSGNTNTPVTELDWVSATGNRNVPHGDGILTITIDKCKLGEFGEGDIHWAASPTVGSGFYAPAYDVTMQIPTAFGWSTPIVDMSVPNYIAADVMDSVTSLTIPSGLEQPFCLCYEFDEAITPETYTIETQVLPT